ncbi:hypothetical protein ACT6NV_01105 [Robiginitalea sp. IMCC44478]|uniref:hypothetical protein n=1 Tax=Robiginitalea sp. IMCC44478 TaxID=3459122 RepID=UPI0040422822
MSLLIFLLTACGGVQESDLNQLAGYWEIKEVVFPDGQSKQYTINSTIDFYQLQAREGFLKKMQPRLDGTYETSDDALPFEIHEREGRYFLTFKGMDAFWEEELLKLDSDQLQIRHSNGLVYDYVRYKPLNIPTANE